MKGDASGEAAGHEAARAEERTPIDADALARLAAAATSATCALVVRLVAGTWRVAGAAGISLAAARQLGAELWTWIRDQHERVLVVDLDAAGGEAWAAPLRARGLAGFVAAPTRGRAAPLGLLVVFHERAHELDAAEEQRLLDAARLAGEWFEVARTLALPNDAGRADRLAAALADLARDPPGRDDVEAGLRRILTHAAAALAGARASVWLFDEAQAQLRCRLLWEPGMGRWSSGEVLRTDQHPTYVCMLVEADVVPAADARRDSRTAELAAHLERTGVTALLAVPLVVDNRRLGALVVEDTAGARTWLDDEIRAARGLAGFANRLLEPSVAARERPLAAFVESNVVPMAISDPEGIMLYANDALGELLGMPAARIIGRRAAELTPLPQSPMPELARLRATGHTPVLSRFLVRELKRADGTVLEIELCMISFKVAEQAFVGYVIRTLSEAERRFRATFADAPLGIVHLDLAGGVIRVNRRFCELVGRSERELRPFISGLDIEAPADQRGPPIAEVLGGDDSLRPERLRALLAGGARHRVERRLVRPDGSAVSLELTFTLAADEAGAAAYVIGTAVDMTSVHAATEALSAVAHATTITGEALFDTLVEAVAQALGARTALVARLGDTVPPRLRTLALWHDGAVRPARELALVDTPAEHVSRVGLAYYPAGVRQLFPDDALLRELGSDTYMGAALRDPQGRTIGVIAVLGDRRFDEARRPESILRLCASRAEAELQRLDAVAQLAAREGQLRQITESMREGFFLATWPGWQVIYASPSFTELYGRSAAELYGRPNGWLDSVHPEDRARVEAIMASPEPLDLDLDHRIIRPDGQMRWLHVRAQLVPSPDGPPTRAAGFVEDVTTLRLTQETLRERERRLAEALLASEEEIVRLQTRLGDSPGLKGLVGSSPAMREAVARLRLAARSDVTVLITGESGTGKELAAAALHEMSGRRARPFVAINCAAIPEPLLESELFGHVKGAFTGATRDKVGLIQMADTGTLFLDEIGDMSPVLQVKVLRALQERQVRRVGDERAIPVDVRLISATHRDLRAQIASGRTREDFYYRIKVFEVELPPLRARKDDVPELALHFVSELCHAAGRTPPGVSADVLRALVQHDWPGNVRELRNAIEHALVSAVGSAIRLADLPVEIRVAAARALQPMATTVPMATPVAPVASATPGEDERVRIEAALERTGGNRSEAAKLLGVSRVTLWKRMRRLGLGAATSDAGEADESTDEQPPRR